MSLRLRLVLLFLGGTSLVGMAVNYVLYTGALAEIDDLWDAHLARSARLLLSVVSASAEHEELEGVNELLARLVPASSPATRDLHWRYHSGEIHFSHLFEFQVYRRDGSLLLKSADAPEEPLAGRVGGLSYRVINGITWRVFGVADPKNALILYAGEEHAVREDLASHLLQHLLLPSLLAIPPLLLLTWIAVTKGLTPLSRLVREVGQRVPNDLRSLSIESFPVEVKPLVDALNSLFARLERALESERRFTGHAAHELRTPLAALRVQAQVAQQATNEARRQRALSRSIEGVDNASHLVNQLLTLARLDSGESALSMGPVNLSEVAHSIAADLEPLARQHRVSVQITGDTEAVSLGDETCLGVLIRNLIDNAIRHSGAECAVTVNVRHSGPFNRVIVRDTGPGIAEGGDARLFERFRRGGGAVAPGSGLGLSIVHRITELHGGGVRLENHAEGGLRCEVRLPAITEEPEAALSGRNISN